MERKENGERGRPTGEPKNDPQPADAELELHLAGGRREAGGRTGAGALSPASGGLGLADARSPPMGREERGAAAGGAWSSVDWRMQSGAGRQYGAEID